MTSIRSTVCAGGCCLLLAVTRFAPAVAATQDGAGDAARGKVAIGHYGCVACHTIPGIPNPGSDIAPPLDHIASRSYIGGVLPNTSDDLQRWLRDPPGVDPLTAMPNMGVSAQDAKDIAAYLHTLK